MTQRKGRACTVCTHPKRRDIDEALVSGREFAPLARKYGLSGDAMRRHFHGHLDDIRRKEIAVELKQRRIAALDKELNEDRSDISTGLTRIINEIDGILQRAKEAGDDSLALTALRDMRGTFLDLAKLHGKLTNISTVRVEIAETPQWAQLKAILVQVFDEVPQARDVFLRKTQHMRLIEQQ